MSDIKLFRIKDNEIRELKGGPVRLEKQLQNLIEQNLEAFLQIRFVASEHPTGKTHAGRIDSLGLDENGCPTIIEYKRNTNMNVINQGLFYLDWLMDHQAEFELLVLKKFGKEKADNIDWSAPRLLCMAEDFTRYDVHAVQQINRNIELIRYIRFDEGLLLLELVNAVVATSEKVPAGDSKKYTTQEEYLEKASPELKSLYDTVREYMLDLGDNTQERILKWYIAFTRLKNFACITIQNQKNCLVMYIHVNPETVDLEEGFSRDVRNVGHHGSGDLELTVKNLDDFEKAKPLILRSFEAS